MVAPGQDGWSLHSWLVPNLVVPVYERLTGRRPWTRMRELQALQWRPPAELEARAARQLSRLLTHAAANVPYYQDRFRAAGVTPSDIRSIADLTRLPISTKADLRAAFPGRTVATNLAEARRILGTTSGSTGRPFEFYLDRQDVDIRQGSYLFFRDWAGTPPWYTRVVVATPSFVPPIYRPPRWLSLSRRLLLGERVEHLHTDRLTPAEAHATISKVARGRPYFLYGPSSYLAYLAARLLEAGLSLPRYPAAVIACGDTLTVLNAAAIERAFRCPVVNHYSTLEVLYLAQSCPDNPAVLHVNAERAIVRVVRPDGIPAAPGELGRVVVTDLANYVMPLINYDLEDLAVAGGPCPCGRGFPTLDRLEGRQAELLRTPHRVVSAATLGHFLVDRCGATRYIWEFQAIQTGPDAVVLRVVPTAEFTPAVAAWIQAELEVLLGPRTAVTIEPTEYIPTEASGKRLVIKSEG